MLPVVAGRVATTLQILIYSLLLVPISLLPWASGYAGALYGVVALACGATFLVLALHLRWSGESDRQAAQRLFSFSIVYLFLLFAALLANSTPDRSSSTVSSGEDVRWIARNVHVAAMQIPFRAAIPSSVVNSDEG